MKHRDLGVLDGNVVLFGGPYSNAQACEALFARVQAAGVAPDHVICTGDIVAYCGSPMACVTQVRASGCAVVAGNCEIQLAQNADDCGCGFQEGTTCDRLSVAWYAFARAQLDEEARAWMEGLPDVVTFHHHGTRYGVIHGGVHDVAQFIWSSDEDPVFDRAWEALEATVGPVDAVIAGHSGLPFIRETPHGIWINAGVIGMPAHDGTPHTRFTVLERGQPRIESLEYDVAAAVAQMNEAGLPHDYRDALLSGYWPSEDVLPSALRVAVSDRG